MKKSFFILFALVLILMSCSKSQATDQNEAVENLTQDYLRGRWSVEVISEEMNIIYIAFDDDGTYYWYSPFGGYMGERGKYTLDGNTVTLFYPNDTMSQWEALVKGDDIGL